MTICYKKRWIQQKIESKELLEMVAVKQDSKLKDTFRQPIVGGPHESVFELHVEKPGDYPYNNETKL